MTIETLLARVHRALSTDPAAFVALRLGKAPGGVLPGALPGAPHYAVHGATLRLSPGGDIPLDPPLTLADLAAACAARGWEVLDLAPHARDRGAIALLDQPAPGRPDGALLAHDSLLWATFAAFANGLAGLAAAARAAPVQLSATTAEGFWLDELGRQYGVPRLDAAEPDDTYARRLVEEVLRPRSNNIAMAAIITGVTGQRAHVRDVPLWRDPFPDHSGRALYDGAHVHNGSAVRVHGLFDVEVGFDLLGSDNPQRFAARTRAQVERLRAAGTLLRDVLAIASGIADPARPSPNDPSGVADLGLAGSATLTDAHATPPTDPISMDAVFDLASPGPAAADPGATSLTATWTHRLDGAWRLDGNKPLAGGGGPQPVAF